MNMFKRLIALLSVTTLLASCSGGGGDAGTSPFGGGGGGGGGGTSSATAIDVLADNPQVGSGGDQVTVSAIVKGAGNVSLADAPVTFTTSSGILTQASVKTDSAGVATAKLSAGANKTNRTITVTATSGAASGNVVVEVTGTTLSFSGATTVPLNRVEQLSVKATDSKGTVISGLAITASSSLGNGLSPSSLVTNAQGNAVLSYTASASGDDQLVFTGAGTTVTAAINVSGEDFVFVSPAASTQVPVNTSQTVVVRYRLGGAPQAGRTVNFSATGGVLSAPSAVTDAAGQASVSVSSTTASPATVQASLQGSVAAQATLPIEFVALTPFSLVLQVTPTAIGPNTGGSTTQQAQVIATVKDINSNPVKGVTVTFNRLADPSGGNFNQPSAVTDASGQASVQYVSGALTTSSNGVQLRAAVPATTVFGDASLTVNQSALFIALATGNTISNVDPQTYNKDWTVYVTDANGNAVANVNLTIKVLPVEYLKGNLAWSGTFWVYSSNVVSCANEDNGAGDVSKAFNGILDPGEDFNGSGQLEPGGVIAVTPRTVRTDANGRATISLQYGESYVPWVRVTLRAEAVVSGTESSKEATFTVTGLASDFDKLSNPPAGVTSPFGVNACTVPN